MACSIIEDIKKIAPELITFINANNDIVDLILADVAEQITSTVYGRRREIAQRYLAAHLLTLINQGANGVSAGTSGPISEEKVGDVQIKYASDSFAKLSDASRYDETKYGRYYMSIRKGRVFPFKVITP